MFPTVNIVVTAFTIILFSIVLIEIYMPTASRTLTIWLKAASVATVLSIITFGVILSYRWNDGTLSENIGAIVGDAVKDGIVKASRHGVDNIRNTVTSTMGAISSTTQQMGQTLIDISKNVKDTHEEVESMTGN